MVNYEFYDEPMFHYVITPSRSQKMEQLIPIIYNVKKKMIKLGPSYYPNWD